MIGETITEDIGETSAHPLASMQSRLTMWRVSIKWKEQGPGKEDAEEWCESESAAKFYARAFNEQMGPNADYYAAQVGYSSFTVFDLVHNFRGMHTGFGSAYSYFRTGGKK